MDKKKVAQVFGDVAGAEKASYEDFTWEVNSALADLALNISDAGVKPAKGQSELFAVDEDSSKYRITFLGTEKNPLTQGAPIAGFTRDEYEASGKAHKTDRGFYAPVITLPGVSTFMDQIEERVYSHMAEGEKAKYNQYLETQKPVEQKESFVLN